MDSTDILRDSNSKVWVESTKSVSLKAPENIMIQYGNPENDDGKGDWEIPPSPEN